MDDKTATSNDILYDLKEGIGKVTFNRPQARNAFTFEMYERLAAICEEANKDHSIKVLVFQGAGDKAFASGTDINQFRAFTTPQHALDYEERIDRVLTQLEQCRVPSAPKARAWDSRSRARSATACRCRISAGSPH
jgi:enoyl-CoA hydratase